MSREFRVTLTDDLHCKLRALWALDRKASSMSDVVRELITSHYSALNGPARANAEDMIERGHHLSPTPSLPCSIPARRIVVLGDVSNTGEIVHCESLTPTIELHGTVYHYCGVSDGIGYYRTTKEIKEIEELRKECK